MKFTHTWLLQHLETDKSPEEIAEKLTAIGLEIEEFEDLGEKFAPFLVAEILEAEKHPNADKLQICKVNDGSQELQIVCGAPNARAGIKVCLAPVGAWIPAGDFKIKASKIRDVESNGMLCAAAELGLGEDSAGIMELDADAVVGSKYSEYAALNDSFFEIAITPNRQDCLGVRGVARDLAASGLGKLKPLESDTQPNASCLWQKFEGVENKQSPVWLQNRLKSIGLEPKSALVDITNFLTFDLGRPAHVYDADKVNGRLKIEDLRSPQKFNALNDKSYELTNELVVADDNGAVALAGVIGNVESSVDENTKNVILEIAYFDPITVAMAGRKHLIDSDARYRFERGVDPEGLQQGLESAAKLITEICGGEIVSREIFGQTEDWKREIEFDFALAKDLGGIDVSRETCEKILTDLGFAVAGDKITPPSWRRDIEGAPDLVEEIIRIIGLDQIEPQVLPFYPPAKKASTKLRDQLAGRGMVEVVTYSFGTEAAAKTFGGGNAALKLTNPISSELSDMRSSILPNLIEAAVRNANRGFKNVAFFETGPVFNDSGEQKLVSGLRAGENADKTIYSKPRNVDAFDAKADLQAALEALGAPAGQIRGDAPDYFHPGRSGGVYLGKNCLGYFGEIHPAILKKMDLEGSAVGFELFLNNIPKSKIKYKALEVSDLQSVQRDFAFLLPTDALAGDLVARITKQDDLITDSQLFDVYEGANIESGKKSIAFSITLQPKKETLKDTEIEAVSQKVIAFVEKQFGGELRS